MSLRDRLASGSFAVTAEISPPRGASTEPVTATAALLRDWVDAVNVTDNQGSNVRLASWPGVPATRVRAGHADDLPGPQPHRAAVRPARRVGPRYPQRLGDDRRPPQVRRPPGGQAGLRPGQRAAAGDAAAHAGPGRRAVRPGAEAAPGLLPRRGGEPLRPARGVPGRPARQEDRRRGAVRADPVRLRR